MSDLLGIASSGVNAYQNALATVSNNIANVNTDGYTRQDVSIAASVPTRAGNSYIGTGARFDMVRRQYDAFIEANLRTSNSDLQSQGPMVTYVNRLIDIMGNESIGLTTAMNGFFDAARDLASNPASDVSRSTFLRDSDGLAARFRQLATQFQLLDDETRQAVESDVGQVNSITQQLAQINKQMARHANADEQPSELLDQRDLLLRKLSDLVAIKTRFAQNGAVLVSVGDTIGTGILVRDDKSQSIAVQPAAKDPQQLQFLFDPHAQPLVNAEGKPDVLPSLTTGKIGGTMTFRDQVLAPAGGALDNLARQLASAVNAEHRNGLDGEGRLGGDLFSFAGGQEGKAAGITSLIQDTRRVAAAGQFRVSDDPLNQGVAQARIAFAEPDYKDPRWALDLQLAGPPAVVTNNEVTIAVNPVPVGLIQAGMHDVVVTLSHPSASQGFQILTRDGRHLLGSGNQSALVGGSAGMEAGARYDASQLAAGSNQRYLGMDLFIGAKGEVRQIQQFDLETRTLLAPEAQPAILRGAVFAAGWSGPVAAGTFTLNGVAMPELSGSGSNGTITLGDVVGWINGQSATGVSASTPVDPLDPDYGRLIVSRAAGNVTDDIRLGLGSAGTPADLGRLGFDTALYLEGSARDDLLVFVSDSAGESTATVSAQTGGSVTDMKQTLRELTLRVDFSSASEYTITDTASNSVLASRSLTGTPPTINYRGLSVTLSAIPQAGDTFTIDGNRDGIGNNDALLAIVDLETAGLMAGGKTMTETYIEQVNQVGNLAKQADISQQALTVVYTQAVKARDAVSGVSLDQEAADLVKFQQAYQANAKAMQIAGVLFDSILQVR